MEKMNGVPVIYPEVTTDDICTVSLCCGTFVGLLAIESEKDSAILATARNVSARLMTLAEGMHDFSAFAKSMREVFGAGAEVEKMGVVVPASEAGEIASVVLLARRRISGACNHTPEKQKAIEACTRFLKALEEAKRNHMRGREF